MTARSGADGAGRPDRCNCVGSLPIGGAMRFQFRAEVYNMFNNVNYGNPGSTFGAASFGRITSAGTMRQVQLGGKILF